MRSGPAPDSPRAVESKNGGPDITPLAAVLKGEVVGPGSATYSEVSKLHNARFDDVQPQAVAMCATPGDIARTLEFARRHHLPTAIRSGGHCYAGRSTTPGIVIDVSRLSSISVLNGIATIGAGNLLGAAYRELHAHGVTIPLGTCPTVGVGGFVLGGGFGMIGRRHGLAVDHLLSARIVLADGRFVECDERREPDLFWALRGAGTGQFGVVTDMSLATIPIPSVTTTFSVIWPFASARAVLTAWMSWMPSTTDEIAPSLALRADGDLDAAPMVEVYGTMVGTRADTLTLLDELCDAAATEPSSSTSEEQSYTSMLEHWADRARGKLDHPGTAATGPRQFEATKSEYFAQPLPEPALVEVVKHIITDRVPGQAREVDFSPWGGAYNRRPADATAFVHRDAKYWIKQATTLGIQAGDDEREGALTWLADSWNLTRPWGNGHVYPNFPDPDLGEHSGYAYYGSNHRRLQAIKTTYDPDNVFNFHQALGGTPN